VRIIGDPGLHRKFSGYSGTQPKNEFTKAGLWHFIAARPAIFLATRCTAIRDCCATLVRSGDG